MTTLLELKNVQAYYGLAHVLQGVSLEVGSGEVVALLGRNGAGKSTTLRSVMGVVVQVRAGEIRFAGGSIRARSTHDIAGRGVAYVPEDRRVFPGLSVRENLRLAALGARLSPEDERRGYADVIELFPALADHIDREANKLSGGLQQMVALGRALIRRPRLLLVDEPTQGLAPLVARAIIDAVVLIARAGAGVLLVEQNAEMALELADRAYVLDEGMIRVSGDATAIAADRDIRRMYLAV